MLFGSYTFLFLFLPLTLLGFRLLSASGHRWLPLAWLVLASLAFYGWGETSDLLPLVGSVLFNFSAGRWISRTVDRRPRLARAFLVCGVAANLALLGYFKYTGFLLETLGPIFGRSWTTTEIVLPLGISFFTFQQIAYLVDSFRGLTREHRLLHYALFVTFFPQLIAGPIVHHRTMLPQFTDSEFRFRARDIAVGSAIFTIGLAKKVLIADEMSSHVGMVFDGEGDLTFGQAWSGTLAYTVQIYFDFSGYSDMAIGLGRLFGIRLPLNFNSPYKAGNIIDFWRRWHMTLSAFLRDYVYFAFGGNRKGKTRRHVHLMLTMLLGGLWHGAGWAFVIWGALHGVYLIVNHAWNAFCRRGGGRAPSGRAWAIAARTLTFLCVVLAWVPFRAETFEGSTRVFSAMVGMHGLSFESAGLGGGRAVMIILALIAAWVLPNTQEMMRAFRPSVDRTPGYEGWRVLRRLRWSPSLTWAMVLAVIFMASVLQMARVGEFIYFRF